MPMYFDETVLPLTGGVDSMVLDDRPFFAYMHIPAVGGSGFLLLCTCGGGGAPRDVIAMLWNGQPNHAIDLRGIQPSQVEVLGTPAGRYKIWFT